jgi:hypothetical protein
MIHEVLMSQGSYEFTLRVDSPLDLWQQLNAGPQIGHIVITPQEIGLGPLVLGDTGMLEVARYVGPLLKKHIDGWTITLSGTNNLYWIGDEEEKSEELDPVTFTNATITTVLASLLPTSVVAGTITEPASNLYSATHEYESRLEAIRTVAAETGCEYRMNNDFTFDMGPSADVYNITAPEIVVTRYGFGSDANYVGVNVQEAASTLDYSAVARSVSVLMEDADNHLATVGGNTNIVMDMDGEIGEPAEWVNPYGLQFERHLYIQVTGNPVSVTDFILRELSEHTIVETHQISTEFFEISNGDMRVGDVFHIYDPPAFTNTLSPIYFRGEYIWPDRLRLIRASWPLRRGMGVYYRYLNTIDDDPFTVEAVYIDLTPFVQWEDPSHSLLMASARGAVSVGLCT